MTHLTTLITVQDIAIRCGVDTTLIERLIDLGIIDTHPGAHRSFPSEVTLRVSKLVRLERDLGLNLDGAALVIELLDRIEQLEARLRHLERR
jgi:hypothetical protein